MRWAARVPRQVGKLDLGPVELADESPGRRLGFAQPIEGEAPVPLVPDRVPVGVVFSVEGLGRNSKVPACANGGLTTIYSNRDSSGRGADKAFPMSASARNRKLEDHHSRLSAAAEPAGGASVPAKQAAVSANAKVLTAMPRAPPSGLLELLLRPFVTRCPAG